MADNEPQHADTVAPWLSETARRFARQVNWAYCNEVDVWGAKPDGSLGKWWVYDAEEDDPPLYECDMLEEAQILVEVMNYVAHIDGPHDMTDKRRGADTERLCYACLCPFLSEEEWDQRHSDADGEDVHEECCDICHGDDSAHRSARIDGTDHA